MNNRAIVIVLDSFGVGEAPDAAAFSDVGADTFGHIYEHAGGLNIPNMNSLGLSNINGLSVPPWRERILGAYGKMRELSHSKDTVCGHWELMGVVSKRGFKTYPDGFPSELIKRFEESIGRNTIGNRAASGTAIINELGDLHVKTGAPIVYTSADSVFQIAAHESVIPLDELYRICINAREILDCGYDVCRVIARPFTGHSGCYTRTGNRRDYAVAPPSYTILDKLCAAGYSTLGIGKIEDIFAHRGLSAVDHTTNNHDGIEATINAMKMGGHDLIFTNLVDFDMLYGHRNDTIGYARALEYFDRRLTDIMNAMSDNDLLVITADHGCDPVYPTTDHTREYVPVLMYSKHMEHGHNIGIIDGFSYVGDVVYEFITQGKYTLPV